MARRRERVGLRGSAPHSVSHRDPAEHGIAAARSAIGRGVRLHASFEVGKACKVGKTGKNPTTESSHVLTGLTGLTGRGGSYAFAGAIGQLNPQNNPTRSSSSATWNGFSRTTAAFSSASFGSNL